LSGGVSDYAVNGLEIRFLAKTNNHNRVIHFKTIGSSYTGFFEEFRTNNATSRSSLTAGTHYELYDGTYRTNNAESGLLDGQIHSAYLPGQTNATQSIQNNEYAMANHTFYKGGTYHWAMTPTRWEVDDMSQNSTNAYHQVWVRANNIPNVFKGGLSVQSASILRTILDTVTFDPTGIAFTGSVIADENNTTNYYTLATTDPNLSRLQVVDLIENSPTSYASVGSNISANSNVVTDSILTQIVDVNNGVYSATAVNKAYVYTYAIDESGSNNHRDIDMKDVGGTDPVYAFALERDKIFPDTNLLPVTKIVNNYIVSDIFTLAADVNASTSVGGFYIDLIPANVGDVYDFENYIDIPVGNTGVMHYGLSLTSTVEPTAANTPANYRRENDPGYYIDFYENTPTTPYNEVRTVTLDEFGSGYSTVAGGIAHTDGRIHRNRYFRATLVSGTTPPVDIQLELFADEERTELVWKINKWSIGSDFYDTLTRTKVYFNFWIKRNVGYVAGQNHYFGNIIKNGGEKALVPYVKFDTIVEPTSDTSGLTISDATIFSSVADIDKYYAFNLVTGVPVSPGTDSFVNQTTLTDDDIIAFVHTYLASNISVDGWNPTDNTFSGINTPGTTVVYAGGYTTDIVQYTVEEVPSLTFTHAFNTLTEPFTTSSISQITNAAEWAFYSYVVAVDTAARYGLMAKSAIKREYVLTFDFTGSDQSFPLVENVSEYTFILKGAGGGDGPAGSSGQGGYTETTVTIPTNTDNQTFTLIVGGAGDRGPNRTKTYGGGGGSGDDSGGSGGRGGGRTAIRIGTTEIVTAGGGSGCGYGSGGTGHNGGGLIGSGGGGTVGRGGSQSAGGSGGSGDARYGEAGSQFTGGTSSINGSGYGGGGGGGGWFGGGGGGGSSGNHGAGGGGSGFIGRNGSSILGGTEFGSSSTYGDIEPRIDTVTGVTYLNSKCLVGGGSTRQQNGVIIMSYYSY
jgi:hypothetical protein